ncbi:MAG TPA: OmpA family protein [Devosiaceae bacterium]|jgi:outer membrane protein OmpA-like peptidoglycan-associated protein
MTPRIIVAGLALLALTACTTTDPFSGDTKLSNTAGGALIGTGGGAVVGAILGSATGNDPRIGALIGAGIGGLAGAGVGAYMDQQESALRAQLQGTGVSVTRSGNQIVLNMPSNITFELDKATVQPQFSQTLISVGLVLQKFDKTIIDVYGYTDSSGDDNYNLDLSQKRAVAVATVLSNQGVDQRRFFIQGRGEADPIAPNDVESGRAQNRRVEIQLSPLTNG